MSTQDIVTVNHENVRCCLMAVSKDIFNRYDYNIIKIFKEDYKLRKIQKKDGWYFNYNFTDKKEHLNEIKIIDNKMREFNQKYKDTELIKEKGESTVVENKEKVESIVVENREKVASTVVENKEKVASTVEKSTRREKELEELLRQRDEELTALRNRGNKVKPKKTMYSSPSSPSSPSPSLKSQSSCTSQSDDDFGVPPKKQPNRYNTRDESSVISTISPPKKNSKKKMDESIVSPPKRNNKMKKILSNFNEEDEEDYSHSPSPKYKTKNPKKLEFYELLQKISSSVKTYSGTTNSDESGSDSDSDSSNRSRSYLSSDSSSDGYPVPKRMSKPPRKEDVKNVKNVKR